MQKVIKYKNYNIIQEEGMKGYFIVDSCGYNGGGFIGKTIKECKECINSEISETIKNNNEDLNTFTETLIENKIDDIFEEVHLMAKTQYGDITPSQMFKLDEIKENLLKLIIEQVNQNL